MESSSFCPRCGQLLTNGVCPSCGTVAAPAGGTDAQRSKRQRNRSLILAGVAGYLVVGLAALTFLAFRFSALFKQRGLFRRDRIYLKHNGPVARLDELHGSGRIYLIQVGPHTYPYSLNDLAHWLHTKYALDVEVLPAAPAYPSAWNAERGQYIAENLTEALKQDHPDIAADPNAYLIGFTDADMYTTQYAWRSTFTLRDEDRAAVISLDDMEDTPSLNSTEAIAAAKRNFQARVRRILLKDVATMYWHLPMNRDPTSLLHNTLDTDLPTEDIYGSDVDPALTPRGADISEPCIVLRYSPGLEIKPLPGPLLHECTEVPAAGRNTASEYFALDLRLGLLNDKRTDLYAYDTIPIAFRRVTNNGWKGINPFGVSGIDNYDRYLSSADNILVDAVDPDEGEMQLERVPRIGLPLAMVKYVTVGNPNFYQMRWYTTPYPHYELRRFDGAVESYLPCLNTQLFCFLTDYHDARGDQLRFERDATRHLLSLTSPHGSWAHIRYDSLGRIAQVAINSGASVEYVYDNANLLIGVTYSTGEVCQYEYDSTHHLLSFSESPDAKTPLKVWLRNEYENGMVVKQTLADGSAISYNYSNADADQAREIHVQTSGGRIYDVKIGLHGSTVHERVASAAGTSIR